MARILFPLALCLLGAAPATPSPCAPKAKAESLVRVVAVGHIVMGTSYPPNKPALPPDDGKGLFANVSELLRGADVAFGNCAAPLSDRGSTKKKVDNVNVFAFRTPASYAANLKAAGFDVVQAANNHIMDFGPQAYQDTLKSLDAQGIAHVGRTDEVYSTTVNGIRVGVVGFTQPYQPFFRSHHDVAAAAEVIRALKKDHDVVIVGLHGGNEGKDSLHTPQGPEFLGSEPRGEVVKAAHAMVDAGASLVVGFGPHLPRAMELYKGRVIDYSLGNFVTYGPFNLRGANGLTLVLEAAFEKSGAVAWARVHPFAVPSPGIPVVDDKKQTLVHLRQLSKEDFPATYPLIREDGCVEERQATK